MIQRIFIVLACLATFVACSEQPVEKTQTENTPETGQQTATTGTTGSVVETMNAGNYTYVKVDTGSEEIWAAAPTFEVAVGDEVTVPEGMAMENFHSDTLDRDFPIIYFVQSIGKGGEMPTQAMVMPPDHPKASAAAEVDTSDLGTVAGATAIADLYAKRDDFAGQEVKIHGKVVKVNLGIMGKNWLHIQDGSGDAADGSNDLTVTTDAVAEVGNTVLVTGPITLDKDFGAGYRYSIIIENATVEVE